MGGCRDSADFYNLPRIRNRVQKLPGLIGLGRRGQPPKLKLHSRVNDKQLTAHSPMTQTKKSNPLLELLINIVIPSVILMKFSGEQDLGAVGGLLVALAFPLGWGAFELIGRSKVSFFAVLGLVSILLTGGIGLLQLDTQWLAVKEAAIPGLLGLAVLVSTRTRYPLVKTLLYNPTLIDVARVQQHLDARGTARDFEARLQHAT
jgi:hypothetical protein